MTLRHASCQLYMPQANSVTSEKSSCIKGLSFEGNDDDHDQGEVHVLINFITLQHVKSVKEAGIKS